MNKPTFSIITPTRNRDGRYERETLTRCRMSVMGQTYPSDLYEHILVDDGNTEPITQLWPVERIIRHDTPTERYIAFNDGMKAAKNEWICFLDDDDEWVPFYLEYLARAISENPEVKLFNFGGLAVNEKELWMRARPVHEFEQKVGASCESGDIVNGQFIFKRECLGKSGYMPDTPNLWHAYDIADIPGYGSDAGMKPLGNPFGNDFYIFYKLTRHYISKPLDLFLYICYLR